MPDEPTPEPRRNRSTKRSAFKLTDRGALYLEFTTGSVTALRPWPARCWASSLGTPARWVGLFEPPFELAERIQEIRREDAGVPLPARMRGAYYVRRRTNMRKLLEHVPTALQDQLLNGWRRGTWCLYRFLRSTPAAADLCDSEEGARVAFVLAHAHALVPDHARAHALRRARALVGRKRRDVMGALGFPATQASVTALSKLQRQALSGDLLVVLRDVLNDEHMRSRAAHLPVLSREALQVLRPGVAELVGHEFLLEIALDQDSRFHASEHTAALIRDCGVLSAELGLRCPLLRSRKELIATHDALALRAREQMFFANQPVPPLPHPLTPDEARWARPLPSLLALLQEGRTMHHCLGSMQEHHDLALSGEGVFFSVHGAERLTLALSRLGRPRTGWCIHDFHGFANSEPSSESWERARALVRRWNSIEAVPHRPRVQYAMPF